MKDNYQHVPGGTWCDPSSRDSRWYVFKQTYMCRVPYLKSMSTDYIRHFGIPTSGDPIYDKQTANELVTRMLTIVQMVEFYKQGTSIYVVNPKDTKDIYMRITDHLNFWKQQLENGWHMRDAPIEDLMLMDKFANAVFNHARQFTTEIVESLVARKVAGTMRVNRQQIMGKRINKPPVDDNGDRKLPEREGMAEMFAQHRNIIRKP